MTSETTTAREALDFVNEYFTQCNHGTRYPIYFVIRDVDWQASYHFEDGDRFVCIYDASTLATADTLKELFETLKKDDEELGLKFPDDLDLDWVSQSDVDEFYTLNKYVNGIFSEKKGYKEHNMFLLESEAKAHLKSNHYHYSGEAHVYCKHAWRAPRQESFIDGLKTMITQAQENE